MEVPSFSNWQRFDEFRSSEIASFPGVYLLAHFNKQPKGHPVVTSSKIIYIGETTGQTIAKRLYNFSRSAFFQKIGHSGGWAYSSRVLMNKITSCTPENLYVSAIAVRYDTPEIERKAYIKLVERLVIWEFYSKNKRYPLCNTA
ncbi:hypothetical protein NA644_19735 [Pseudomonas stutzeri]|jgi:hypothetical protein|uniref:hypothetical protein n=1 Tax=Stutzerimonas stutzeri TaxID=316 RepID=UPI0011AF4614|nr:hypothetical protein [Stutzerimonas stutzeri]MCQ4251546.1 hypothetical protein [Stutzerimonas stutzeri]